MTIAYDGRGFRGFAAQPGVMTVGGSLAECLQRVLGQPVDLTCAGRTDAGVHAWGQVVSFDAPSEGLDLESAQRAVNKLLGPGVVIRAAEVTASDFDARRSARARCYRYTVLNRPLPDPFLAATTWHVEDPLDVRAMALACDPIIGEHDFSSFCRQPRGEPASMVRRVHAARWLEVGDGVLRFDIEATSFCQQMVRALTGTMVDMGRSHLRPGDMTGILRSGDRTQARQLAPPQGLCLWHVKY